MGPKSTLNHALVLALKYYDTPGYGILSTLETGTKDEIEHRVNERPRYYADLYAASSLGAFFIVSRDAFNMMNRQLPDHVDSLDEFNALQAIFTNPEGRVQQV